MMIHSGCRISMRCRTMPAPLLIWVMRRCPTGLLKCRPVPASRRVNLPGPPTPVCPTGCRMSRKIFSRAVRHSSIPALPTCSAKLQAPASRMSRCPPGLLIKAPPQIASNRTGSEIFRPKVHQKRWTKRPSTAITLPRLMTCSATGYRPILRKRLKRTGPPPASLVRSRNPI